MPEATQRDLHVDQLLTNMSIGYKNTMYIADDICPLVPVVKRSDLVPKYDQSHWFRNQAHLRAPATKSRRGGFTVSHETYYCHRYSFGFEIADDVRDNTDQPFDLDRDGTMFVTDKMQLSREVRFATDHFTTGVWGSDKTGGVDFDQWSDYASSTPLVDLTTYADDIEGKTARVANTLVLGKQVWVHLKWHPDIIDTIKYTERAQMTTDVFASLADIDRVLVGRAIVTTSPMGTAEASVTYTRIWGKNALMMYTTSAPSLMTPAGCYTFVWRRVPNALQYVKRMRDEEREIDIIEGNSYFDQKVTAPNVGVFLASAVA